MSNNTHVIDREALRREGWQVIESDEEKRAAEPKREFDEFLSHDEETWSAIYYTEGNDRFFPGFTYRRRIPAPASGWINAKDRLPTEADANAAGEVIWGKSAGVWFGNWEDSHSATHWMPIPPLPEPVKPKSQEELDIEAAKAAFPCPSYPLLTNKQRAYLTGLRAGRQSDSTRARGGKGGV